MTASAIGAARSALHTISNGQPRVLVIGDAILDRYHYGTVNRKAPEAADVDVFEWQATSEHLGGAAGVALMCHVLGADVRLASVLGRDDAGERLTALSYVAGLRTGDLEVCPDRMTTVKERFAVPEPCGVGLWRWRLTGLRCDRETRAAVEEGAWRRPAFERLLGEFGPQVIIIVDYAKGACGRELYERLATWGERLVIGASQRSAWQHFPARSLLCCNHAEYVAYHAHGRSLRAVVRTHGAEGMDVMIGGERQEHWRLPTTPRNVVDVTGCGDQVLAIVGCGLGCGADLVESCRLANIAGGMQAERWAVDPVSTQELLEEMARLEEGGPCTGECLPTAVSTCSMPATSGS